MNRLLDFEFMVKSVPSILEGLPTTLLLTFISLFFALIIGFITALIRMYKVSILKEIAAVYVSFTRGTPLLVQMYLSYYGIPKLLDYLGQKGGWTVDISSIPAIFFALFSFSLNVGAYLSETIRSAIEAVDKGQMEAALTIGMTPYQGLKRIVLPQAFVIMLPNLGNSLISLLKDTSLAFSISIVDMMSQAKIVGAQGFNFFEVYIVVALLYWVICIAIENSFKLIESRVKRYRAESVL